MTLHDSEKNRSSTPSPQQSGKSTVKPVVKLPRKLSSVDTYIDSIPTAGRLKFDELRQLVKQTLPQANETISYGILGYKIDEKRARVFISGWKNHVAMYPLPTDPDLRKKLTPYIRGKGTMYFPLDKPLPATLITACVKALAN